MPAISEALAALDACDEQVRQCVYIALSTDHPDEVVAHIERFRKHFAKHPEQVRA